MRTMRLAIMQFTRDLRVHDNPALDAAIGRAQAVVPLFVLEDRLITGALAAPNRVRFLLEAPATIRRPWMLPAGQRGGYPASIIEI
jgi:deoxyribodipyrimidine photolyase